MPNNKNVKTGLLARIGRLRMKKCERCVSRDSNGERGSQARVYVAPRGSRKHPGGSPVSGANEARRPVLTQAAPGERGRLELPTCNAGRTAAAKVGGDKYLKSASLTSQGENIYSWATVLLSSAGAPAHTICEEHRTRHPPPPSLPSSLTPPSLLLIAAIKGGTAYFPFNNFARSHLRRC